MRVSSASRTDATVSDEVCRTFRESVRISGGMGFSPGGIAIPPDVVRNNDIQDGDVISGRAVINLDKKKRVGGWKAIATDAINADIPSARLRNGRQ